MWAPPCCNLEVSSCALSFSEARWRVPECELTVPECKLTVSGRIHFENTCRHRCKSAAETGKPSGLEELVNVHYEL